MQFRNLKESNKPKIFDVSLKLVSQCNTKRDFYPTGNGYYN